jgi:hypothetical protein
VCRSKIIQTYVIKSQVNSVHSTLVSPMPFSPPRVPRSPWRSIFVVVAQPRIEQCLEVPSLAEKKEVKEPTSPRIVTSKQHSKHTWMRPIVLSIHSFINIPITLLSPHSMVESFSKLYLLGALKKNEGTISRILKRSLKQNYRRSWIFQEANYVRDPISMLRSVFRFTTSFTEGKLPGKGL